jgi:hypothetical protein
MLLDCLILRDERKKNRAHECKHAELMRSQGRSFHVCVCVGLAGQNEKADKAYTQVRFLALGLDSHAAAERVLRRRVLCSLSLASHQIHTKKTVPTSQLYTGPCPALFLSHTKTFLA